MKSNHSEQSAELWFRAVRKQIPPMWATYAYQALLYYKRDLGTDTGSCPSDVGNLPSQATPWLYWHAYYASPEKNIPKYDGVESLWYSGLALYKCDYVGSYNKETPRTEETKTPQQEEYERIMALEREKYRKNWD